METCPNCAAPAAMIEPDMRGLNRGHWRLLLGGYHFIADCDNAGATMAHVEVLRNLPRAALMVQFGADEEQR